MEWCAHMLEGEFCHEQDGGKLEPQNLQRKSKNAARADGIFGVCSPMPPGGRRREGRTITPLCYRGKVTGMVAYNKALTAEIEKVRRCGLENWKKRAAQGNTGAKSV